MSDDVDLAAQPGLRKISVGDLIRQCQDAAGKMSLSNPNRLLLTNCGYALQQLVDRLHEKVH